MYQGRFCRKSRCEPGSTKCITSDPGSPGVPDENKQNPAIRKGYVDLKAQVTEEVDGKKYEKRISNYYPMPPVKK